MSGANETAVWCGSINMDAPGPGVTRWIGPTAPPLRSMSVYCSEACKAAKRHRPAAPPSEPAPRDERDELLDDAARWIKEARPWLGLGIADEWLARYEDRKRGER